MDISNRLYTRIGNPLEWTSTRKAAFLIWIYFFQQGIYMAWLLWLPGQGEFEQHFNRVAIADHTQRFIWLQLVSLGLIVITGWAQLRKSDHLFYEYLATLYFGVTHVYYGYCVGLMSLPVGVVLVGAPVVGFIFFNRRAVALAFVSALLAVSVLSYLTYMGRLPYAPLAEQLYLQNHQLSPFWLLAYCVFASPHLLIIFALTYYVLQRWRVREQEANYHSRTDSLTGLVNRRCILELLEQEQKRSVRERAPLSVVMVDLDHFKLINDSWGHQVGDAVLVLASRALKHTLRQHDHVGRYGGEEFLVILPGLEAEQARNLAERIRVAIGEVMMDLPGGQHLSLSASLGMTSVSATHPVSVDVLIKQADTALYQAKSCGRDQVVVMV
ncbi:MAG: hypothetical protein CMK83_26900 [Pseudomonadales bacterium]|uniref:GGDEF domain-containing protein n=1 Tax=unclassified Ketobacter TaxID=2639109 RepID=UPI000C92A596|nr:MULTISPECIES: GGDEF domain-containing protein [unclassified Ketobacter]MAQ27855.1 hypothetical protein [Pseudomonadales bacterium]MEC8813479.1 GGDEF domain-containing protein [Pseudomonadota bacterium]HAG95892.1 hypothetical protein [Gammaproteobacteria bacterium]MCK5789746.1 GGDEF domain-containing protein [Ketobacter sp.]RLT91734.1 MAG: GGDEF domain-containing protein [Ketobacter sp. GenoA1]|tara:strand:+ start:939 stop:2090 length:1152 start_codon:yes stop_codon:yes gene_type:complete